MSNRISPIGRASLAFAALLAPIAAAAEEPLLSSIDLSGFVAAEGRYFFQEPRHPGQFEGLQPSIILQPEFSYDSEDGEDLFSFIPFFRLDGRDNERTHGDIREAYWRRVGDDWEALIGLNTVFWGVTESRHLVNVINQVDQVEDIDQEDFLGQPMVNVGWQQDWGRLDAFVMSGFRKRRFPSQDGRLRPAIRVDEDSSEFESGLEEAQPEIALRYSHYMGDWDVGTYYFYGTGREPRLVPSTDGTTLEPRYDLIHQVGLDLQYTIDAWLWKFEGIFREGHGDPFAATVGGFEYTYFQIFDSDADLGFLAEYLYDGRDETDAPPILYNNDVFVGSRLVLNDVDDSMALVGTIVDLEHGSTSLFIEAERRIGDNWKVELESRMFFNAAGGDPMSAIEKDDFVLLRVSRFF